MDIKFEFEVNNFAKFKELLKETKDQALTSVGEYGKGEIKLRTPVGQYTDGRVGGRLRDGNDYKVEVDKGAVHFGNDVEYGIYVHEGTSKNPNKQQFITDGIHDNLGNIEELLKRAYKSELDNG